MVDDVVMGPPHLPPGSAPTKPTLPYLPYPGDLFLGGPVLPYPYPSSLAVAVLVELDLNFTTQCGVAPMSFHPLARPFTSPVTDNDAFRQFFSWLAREMDNSFSRFPPTIVKYWQSAPSLVVAFSSRIP
ncbi:hypothetical protein F5Y13DRAFT_159431 [Hypoxylon sp. FL1857]|nr:hypothetical protein F5Y13DRAFT_159431 [Hypoxylon sp. FL1857]